MQQQQHHGVPSRDNRYIAWCHTANLIREEASDFIGGRGLEEGSNVTDDTSCELG